MLGKGIVASASAAWMDVAEREKFLVLYPLGLKGSDGKTGWNDCRAEDVANPRADDVAFVKGLLDFVGQHFEISRDPYPSC